MVPAPPLDDSTPNERLKAGLEKAMAGPFGFETLRAAYEYSLSEPPFGQVLYG